MKPKLTFAFRPVKAEAGSVRSDFRYGRLNELQLRVGAPLMIDQAVSDHRVIEKQCRLTPAGQPEAA